MAAGRVGWASGMGSGWASGDAESMHFIIVFKHQGLLFNINIHVDASDFIFQ